MGLGTRGRGDLGLGTRVGRYLGLGTRGRRDLGLDLSVNAKSRSTLQSGLLALKALAPVEIEIGA